MVAALKVFFILYRAGEFCIFTCLSGPVKVIAITLGWFFFLRQADTYFVSLFELYGSSQLKHSPHFISLKGLSIRDSSDDLKCTLK